MCEGLCVGYCRYYDNSCKQPKLRDKIAASLLIFQTITTYSPSPVPEKMIHLLDYNLLLLLLCRPCWTSQYWNYDPNVSTLIDLFLHS